MCEVESLAMFDDIEKALDAYHRTMALDYEARALRLISELQNVGLYINRSETPPRKVEKNVVGENAVEPPRAVTIDAGGKEIVGPQRQVKIKVHNIDGPPRDVTIGVRKIVSPPRRVKIKVESRDLVIRVPKLTR